MVTGATPPALGAAWLEQALADLFPAPCATAWRIPTAAFAPLPPAEAAAIVRAVDRRRAEFAAGRDSARRALARVGLPEAVVPAGPDRAPIWPAGTVGSIAHAEGMAVAVAARAQDFLSLGVDIELSGRVQEELWPHILTEAEGKAARLRPAPERVPWATAIFAIKEAFYKFQYPLSRRWLHFREVEVETAASGGTFAVRTEQPLPVGPELLSEFSGRYIIGPTFTLAGIHHRLR
jgi:4'-phosphopantetheinyl transferase EntD